MSIRSESDLFIMSLLKGIKDTYKIEIVFRFFSPSHSDQSDRVFPPLVQE
jgi:hypothetical protein